MKKTSIAIGIVVILGGIWSASSWYIGKRLDKQKDKLLTTVNQYLNNQLPQLNVVARWQDWRRGWFTSDATLILQSKYKNVDLPKLTFAGHIQHGPLPLAQLKQGNLLPALALVQSHFKDTALIESLFGVSASEPMISAETRISFAGATSHDITLMPMNLQDLSFGKFNFDGAALTVDIDPRADEIAYQGKINGATFTTAANKVRVPITFSFENVSFKSKTHADTGFRIGEQTLTVAKFATEVKEQGKPINIVLEKLSNTARNNIEKKKLGYRLDYAVDKLTINQQNLGQGSLIIVANDINADVLNRLARYFHVDETDAATADEAALLPTLPLLAALPKVTEDLPLLFKSAPSLHIRSLNWKNSQGDSTFDLDLAFKDPGTSTSIDDGLYDIFDRYLKSVDMRLNIDPRMLTNMLENFLIGIGAPAQEASQHAQVAVSEFTAFCASLNLFSVQNEKITSQFSYSDQRKQFALNGQRYPLDKAVMHEIQSDLIRMLSSAEPADVPTDETLPFDDDDSDSTLLP